ncbi:RING-H2 finger protein ATL3 [Elaeis guineensis]|uniref:RING-type E3 ubiquitin transferase n=1 Tax=Elaeis guineensis var. tenera TaxID=51953 RepID=A0A6I9S9B4_ELAGV|nr:RING-H2 finger protein ATL3 [Elaeis guineensis]
MSQQEELPKNSSGLSPMATTEIMVAAVIVIFMAFLFVFFFYLRAKRYWGANPTLGRSRLAFADEAAVPQRALDLATVKALPSLVFRPEEFKEGLECAVCLSELSEGDEARFLPNCKHGFHLECIDMWLHSHSTCPLCRCPLVAELSSENADSAVELAEVSPVEAALAAGRSPEPPIFPTNVLFPGFQDQVNTGGSATPAAAVAAVSCGESSSCVASSSGKPEGVLVIEIPRQAMEGYQSPLSPLPSSRLPLDEIKSPASARLRSLRWLLSRGNWGIGSSCSPRGSDMEQGVAGLGVTVDGDLQIPKTSTSS